MRPLLLLILASIFTSCSILAQQANPDYDPVLAASVEADDYGMKNYVMAILRTGPKDSIITDKAQRAELFRGHMENIKRLASEKKLVVAGPFGKNDLTYRGLFILNVKTIEEARALCNTDPAVAAGIFELTLIPWYGSAALGEYLPSSEKVSKYKF
jgi:uncharacterized protein YciI